MKIQKKCSKDEPDVCDFCCHFDMFKNKDGFTIDGTGYCGLHRKKIDAGDGCRNYYCKIQWQKNMPHFYKRKVK